MIDFEINLVSSNLAENYALGFLPTHLQLREWNLEEVSRRPVRSEAQP